MPGRRSEVTERRNRVARQSPNSVKRAYAMSDAISRRSLFKAAGAVGVAAALPGEGVARPATPLAEPSPAKPLQHMHAAATGVRFRSEERRVGKEGGSTCRARWSQVH